MSARDIRVSILCCMVALVTTLIVLVFVLELTVALKFWFPDFLDFDLPSAAITWAMWLGASLWVFITWNPWMEISERSNYGDVIYAITVLFLAAASMMGIVLGPFWFAVFLNAVAWCMLTTALAFSLPDIWVELRFQFSES